MQNPSRGQEASDLIYQGPLIGMRSTRPKQNSADANKKTADTNSPRKNTQ